MAEWSNAHDSKSCYVGTRTGVRIPLSAPQKRFLYKGPFFVAKKQQSERDSREGGARGSERIASTHNL